MTDISKYIKIVEGFNDDEDFENPDRFDPEFIAKFIAIHSVDNESINVLFAMPINEADNIGDDITVTISKIQMSVSVALNAEHVSQHGDLVLYYDFEPPEEDDDDYTIRDMIMNWFEDYTDNLFQHLTDKGFSQSAAFDVELEGFGVDQVDYYAGGIANEISESVKFILNQKLKVILSKFGPAILLADLKFSAADLLPYKHTIIKYILSDIKQNGVQSELANDIATKLTNLGVDWPELSVIQNSLDSAQ